MHSIFLSRSPAETIHVARAVVAPVAIPEAKWPIWAAALSFFKSEKDIGVGDTVERIIGKTNSAAFKSWHLKTFGKSCGCTERKALWNAKFPYKQT